MSYSYSHQVATLINNKHEEDPGDPIFTLGAICVARNIVPSVIGKRLKVSKQTVYDWFSQKYSPRPDTLDEINKYIKELQRKTKKA